MYLGRTTLSKFLMDQLRDQPDGELLAALLVDVAAAVRNVATLAARPRRADPLEALRLCAAGSIGPGPLGADALQTLEAAATDAMLRHCEASGLVAGLAARGGDAPWVVEELHRRGPYLLAFTALDATANLDVDAPLGTVFSVLPWDSHAAPGADGFLRPGVAQLAAGYAIYGPATQLVITVGRGSHGFTLDREFNNFILTHPDLRVAHETREVAIDTSHERFWEAPVSRYAGECKAGRDGARGHDFTMRWAGSPVAEVHRILLRGGVYLEPRDTREAQQRCRLHLGCEAAPLALLLEQAGGLASTGRGRLLEVVPGALQEHVPAILGSRAEVLRLELYHQEFDSGIDRPYRSPLFRERSLYRPEDGHCGRAATCPQSTL